MTLCKELKPRLSNSLKYFFLFRSLKDAPVWRVKKWGYSFDGLLKDPLGRQELSKFLAKEFSEENLRWVQYLFLHWRKKESKQHWCCVSVRVCICVFANMYVCGLVNTVTWKLHVHFTYVCNVDPPCVQKPLCTIRTSDWLCIRIPQSTK